MSYIISRGTCYDVPEAFLQPWMELPRHQQLARTVDAAMLDLYKEVFVKFGRIPDILASHLVQIRLILRNETPHIDLLRAIWDDVELAFGDAGIQQFATPYTREDFLSGEGEVQGTFAYDLDKHDTAVNRNTVIQSEMDIMTLLMSHGSVNPLEEGGPELEEVEPGIFSLDPRGHTIH